MARQKNDRFLSLLMAMMFSFSLNSLTLVVPLMAVRAGYDPAHVGLLVALAAVTQIGTRLSMGALMRRIPDKIFLMAAAALIALSCILILFSTTLFIFAAAQLVQGAARALFWTSGQTHAVRGAATSVGGLRSMNLAAGVGSMAGPALAGLLWGLSAPLPLIVASVVGFAAVIPAALLTRFPPFARKVPADSSRTHVRHLPGVRVACGMNTAAGVWRSILDSYVPIALSLAGQPAAVIGLLLTTANAAMMAGSAASNWVRGRGIKASCAIGLVGTGLGLAAISPLASVALAAAASLAVSGLGAGILQTVGPAIAVDEVADEERGDALALTGTYRAAALFLAPLGMAGVLLFVPLTTSLIAAGLLITAPAALPWRQRRSK
jgi:MFS family permease